MLIRISIVILHGRTILLFQISGLFYYLMIIIRLKHTLEDNSLGICLLLFHSATMTFMLYQAVDIKALTLT